MAIENVSDTARWVAVYRAMESARPDAIFRDPFAERLAGRRGQEIVDQLPQGRASAWPMIVRTAVFDEIIREAVASRGVDLVLNLAAGLDARPWRLPLPPSLHWVDADLPGILNYKTEMLAGETPVCRYEAVTIDLTDLAARRALFSRLGAESKCTLVVSEGLLIYLEPEQVGSLAADLHAQPSFAEWLIDLGSPQLIKRLERTWGKSLAEAPFRFAPAEGTEFFRPHGWREAEYRSMWEEAGRLHRSMKGAWFWNLIGRMMPKKTRDAFRRFSGIVRFERTA